MVNPLSLPLRDGTEERPQRQGFALATHPYLVPIRSHFTLLDFARLQDDQADPYFAVTAALQRFFADR